MERDQYIERGSTQYPFLGINAYGMHFSPSELTWKMGSEIRDMAALRTRNVLQWRDEVLEELLEIYKEDWLYWDPETEYPDHRGWLEQSNRPYYGNCPTCLRAGQLNEYAWCCSRYSGRYKMITTDDRKWVVNPIFLAKTVRGEDKVMFSKIRYDTVMKQVETDSFYYNNDKIELSERESKLVFGMFHNWNHAYEDEVEDHDELNKLRRKRKPSPIPFFPETRTRPRPYT